MSDDQDEASMAVMPNVKALLTDNGTMFTNSFVAFPVCCPSRATFITGQHSHNNGIQANGPPHGGYLKFHNSGTEDNTLQMWLKEAGYKTAAMGKYLNGYGSPESGGPAVPPGWDRWFGLMTLGYFNYTASDNGSVVSYGSAASDYSTDVIGAKAVDFISSQSNSAPFFLMLTPYAPHHDPTTNANNEFSAIPAPRHAGRFSSLTPPKLSSFNEPDVSDKPGFMRDPTNPLMDAVTISALEKRYQKRLEALLALDEMVANVVKALENSGKLNNTVIIYTSDNGWFNGEHRISSGKGLLYEEAIRVPLIIRGPGIPNEQRSQLVSNIDLAPTIVDLARATPRRLIDGKSILPLLQSNSSQWRSTLFFEGTNSHRLTLVKLGTVRGVRTSRFMYMEHSTSTIPSPNSPVSESELYDLQVDPYQLENKYSDPAYATVLTSLKSSLSVLKTCAGSNCWNTDPEPVLSGAKPTAMTLPSDSHPPTPKVFSIHSAYASLPSTQLSYGIRTGSTTSSQESPRISPLFSARLRLHKGQRGPGVIALQRFLAQDSTLYPEGLVTGYFENSTMKAVIRFQERYAMDILQPQGLSKGTGYVGSATLKKLNQIVQAALLE